MSIQDAATKIVSIGDILAGKYRVERILGMGGMGVVVAAKHLDLQEVRAIKLMRPTELSNRQAVERFLREARASVRLRSEHVAEVYDVGRLESGAPYIVMELLRGEDLAEVLKKRGPLSISEAVLYIMQACDALAEAHGLGIIHRDLKPANLFLTQNEDGAPCIKVLDFGISKHTVPEGDSPEVEMTGTRDVMGSPLYMSPEQMRSARQVDARSDIWALGAILYKLLTGKTPFQGATMPEIFATVLDSKPARPPSVHRPDIPRALDAVVLRCLEKNPARRYGRATDLLVALGPFGPQAADDDDQTTLFRPGAAVKKLDLAGTIPMAPGHLRPATQAPAERSATHRLEDVSGPSSNPRPTAPRPASPATGRGTLQMKPSPEASPRQRQELPAVPSQPKTQELPALPAAPAAAPQWPAPAPQVPPAPATRQPSFTNELSPGFQLQPPPAPGAAAPLPMQRKPSWTGAQIIPPEQVHQPLAPAPALMESRSAWPAPEPRPMSPSQPMYPLVSDLPPPTGRAAIAQSASGAMISSTEPRHADLPSALPGGATSVGDGTGQSMAPWGHTRSKIHNGSAKRVAAAAAAAVTLTLVTLLVVTATRSQEMPPASVSAAPAAPAPPNTFAAEPPPPAAAPTETSHATAAPSAAPTLAVRAVVTTKAPTPSNDFKARDGQPNEDRVRRAPAPTTTAKPTSSSSTPTRPRNRTNDPFGESRR